MNYEERNVEDIRNDFKIVISNKLSISQSRLLFMGIIYELILRKDIFPRNDDLKGFINNIFVKKFNNKTPFKEYLYNSRTLLASRLQKNIISELNYTQIIEVVNEILTVLPDYKEKQEKVKKTKKNNDTYVSDWINLIKNKE
ncbi:hypothetical protein [Tissierella sp.]|uniref:hypothetical protein n=1 Tax=Tissierella sp. TaxID=41274 RepID=UPI0028AE73F1|nr:hypothetical protein [Tissierella sp.]